MPAATLPPRSAPDRSDRAASRRVTSGRRLTWDIAAYESPIDRAIREATERGAFDNLAGAGKPLPPTSFSGDDFLRRWAAEEESGRSFLPMSLQLRKEAHDIRARVAAERSEQSVRDIVADLNTRISNEIRMPTSQPPLAIGQLDLDEIVGQWRAERERRAAENAAALTERQPPVKARKRWWRRASR